MGTVLITQAMARRYQLGMASYDRLFPNQDSMPRGGFGNLIALPLQHEARAHGNTLFVDDWFEPWPDQWTYLSGLPRLAPEDVERIADLASRDGGPLGVRDADPASAESELPWVRAPSGRPKGGRLVGPLPEAMNAVLAQRLFVEKVGAPAALLDRIQRLAAFQNPEFYKKQRMRLSTHATPRVISCAEDLPEYLALPRGCVDELQALLKEQSVRLLLADRRTDGQEIDVSFRGRLTPVQETALRRPPATGKTVLGTYLVAQRRRSTLILVHRQQLVDQWIAQLVMFLGIEEKDIGQIGAGKNRPNGRLDVAMLQSLARHGSVDDRVADYGHVIVDECHHLPAFSFERVLNEVKARYVVGLTATAAP